MSDKFTALARKRAMKKLAAKSKIIAAQKEKIAARGIGITPYEKYAKYTKYQTDPVGFIVKELGITLWEDQITAAVELTKPPYRVFCCASHTVGKTYLAACLALWMAFCFPDSITLSTAPTQVQVEDLLWKLIRSLNNIDQSIMIGKGAPKFEVTKSWYGLGRTPSSGDSFQGYHSKSGDMLIIMDEAVGIDNPEVWEAVHGMDNDRVRIFIICNPTDISSIAYQEYISNYYSKIHISGLNHPNVKAFAKGEPPPFPGAIQGEHWFNLLKKWSDVVDPRYVKDTDIEFPPDSGEHYRPGALALSRLLGEWPIEAGESFFGALHIKRLLGTEYMDRDFNREYDGTVWGERLQIGIDIARKGNDFSCVSIRYENMIVQHDRIHGLDTVELFEHVRENVGYASSTYEVYEYDIPIVVDITGLGAGLFDLLSKAGYNVMDLNFAQRAIDKSIYANARTELYGILADRCKNKDIILDKEIADLYGHLISQQLLGSIYTYDRQGRYILIPKDKISKNIGMSPDDTDAIALACYPFFGRLSVFIDE